jgi:hypothetical protein
MRDESIGVWWETRREIWLSLIDPTLDADGEGPVRTSSASCTLPSHRPYHRALRSRSSLTSWITLRRPPPSRRSRLASQWRPQDRLGGDVICSSALPAGAIAPVRALQGIRPALAVTGSRPSGLPSRLAFWQRER